MGTLPYFDERIADEERKHLSIVENIYSFRINRVEPLYVPLLSRLTGPFRYDFLVGSLRGHTTCRSLDRGALTTPNRG